MRALLMLKVLMCAASTLAQQGRPEVSLCVDGSLQRGARRDREARAAPS
jgi:hypothetical protein